MMGKERGHELFSRDNMVLRAIQAGNVQNTNTCLFARRYKNIYILANI